MVGSEAVSAFAVYSPRQEDIAAAERELEGNVEGQLEGQLEGKGTASEGGATSTQVDGEDHLLSLPCAEPGPTPPALVDEEDHPLTATQTDCLEPPVLPPAEQVEIEGGLHSSSVEGGLHSSSVEGGLHSSSVEGGLHSSSVEGGLHSSSVEGEGSTATPPAKSTQDLKVQFVLEREAEEVQHRTCIAPSESGLPAGWLMSPGETSGSGGMAFTIWGLSSTPPPPRAPPPLFTPYKPDIGPSSDDGKTIVLDQSRDSVQEEDLGLATPPLPASSPPLLTPTKVDMDVPHFGLDETDGTEPRSEMDLSAVLEEAFHELSRPSSEHAGDKEEHTQEEADESVEQSCEIDVLSAGIYSEVFQGKEAEGRVSKGPKWSVTPNFESPADGDYAVPADSLSRKRDSSDVPEGYVAYATVDGVTKMTHHVKVKTLERDLSVSAETADGDRPTSVLSEEPPYATVISPNKEHMSVQEDSEGAPVMDSSTSKKDKLGVSLHGDKLGVSLHGDKLGVSLHGDKLGVSLHGDELGVSLVMNWE